MTRINEPMWTTCSDFEPIPIKQCWQCSGIFTREPGPLCNKCINRKIEEKTIKKTSLPPTEKQLERINELKDLPEFQEHLDWLLTAIQKGMLNTRGQAGILINQMKKKSGLTP